ncbi:MAG: hypothetical protein CMB97_01700 [Flavobacteriaceae bacterium]|uniref:Uncharacterized protein n=1 Tax=Zunongwangia atlantica 22II14-10F7 TaxID=1185767 RepID=A0A1Y1T887_9FLAO|nr:hypothetical protein [Flavobacteriaceae bacterium]ORL47277.1 hypothetical protein IIF7_00910 [Zunongwangia atlantica 22II14-10F7]
MFIVYNVLSMSLAQWSDRFSLTGLILCSVVENRVQQMLARSEILAIEAMQINFNLRSRKSN